eukprot:3934944-Rhodomonas_salina.2
MGDGLRLNLQSGSCCRSRRLHCKWPWPTSLATGKTWPDFSRLGGQWHDRGAVTVSWSRLPGLVSDTGQALKISCWILAFAVKLY